MHLFLFILSLTFCSKKSDMYYNMSNYNITCSNKNEGCSFNVSYNNSISPKIPTSFPSYAILSDYRYVYLIFDIPKAQNKKTFYLEAYDISDEETIISNGDCYFINTTENINYEIRIYKNLKNDSYIRFGFLGISKNFTMRVNLRFTLSISLYFSDIALDFYNSLNRSDIPSLSDDLEENDRSKNQPKIRATKAKERCSQIMERVFNTSIDITLFEDQYLNSIKIPVSPFLLLTISYSVRDELTTENIFQPESNILSETTIKDREINIHFNGLDFLKGKLNINNNIYKIVELYNKIIKDIISKFGKEINFTLIISTDKNNNFVIYTLRYYYENTQEIDYEIQIIIQFINLKLKELVLKPVELYDIIPFRRIDSTPETCNMSLKGKKFRDLLGGALYFVGISVILYEIPYALILGPIIIDYIDTAEVGAFLLQMEKDDHGNYHAIFDCWQQYFGYTKFYDFIFDIFTDMECNNEGMFTFNNQNYILWAWKGDYINLGAGAELGIYYGGKSKDSIWKVNKTLAMPMTLTLTHKVYGTIVDNWNNWGNDAWWITAFNPNHTKVKAIDLTAYYTVQFKNEKMFNEFSKTPRIGWSYNKTNKIASLIL